MSERKIAKPVEAWAVVDKDNKIVMVLLQWTEDDDARIEANLWDEHHLDRSPHRVARVKIKEVKETGNDRS